MKMYYVSHPFTGAEEKNRQEARNITELLKRRNPQYIFINPLDAFRYAEGKPYAEIMKQCLELLMKCDGLILTGDWESSNGCNIECQEAERLGIPIIDVNNDPTRLGE